MAPDHPPVRDAAVEWKRAFKAATRARSASDFPAYEAHLIAALAIAEWPGADPRYLPISLLALADCYREQGRYAEAEAFYGRGLEAWAKHPGPDDMLAVHLSNLGQVYYGQRRYADAETMVRRALAIQQRCHGPQDARLVPTLENLAGTLEVQGKQAEAREAHETARVLQRLPP